MLPPAMPFAPVPDLIAAIRSGRMVVMVDDEDRENEGDLIIAAEHADAASIAFMATKGCGLICLAMEGRLLDRLGLSMMTPQNRSRMSTAFTVSIEAREGITTGISAADRARTIQAAVSRQAKPKDIVQPGHIFPLMAQPGGVLSRAGHTEAGCDLARMAGFEPAAVIVEIMNDDGNMARRPDLERFAQTHNLKIGTIADLIHYRTLHERTVVCTNSREVETLHGPFTLKTYKDTARNECHFAFVKGPIKTSAETLVRVHVGSTLRDVLGIQQPGASGPAWTCQSALACVAKEGAGVVVLICHNETTDDIEESIDWLLTGKVRRPNVELAYKQVGTGSQILKDLGVCKMRLMSAPYKFNGISGFNLEVTGYIEHPSV
jgi:3,4-dihydroxy 2-butanone 4-phosphate synthase/GTP cyclohydrolase II